MAIPNDPTNGARALLVLADNGLIKIDPAKNKRGCCGIISTDDSTVKVLRIPTNEELPIARDTLEIVSNL